MNLKHHWIARPLSIILTLLNLNLATAFFSVALMAVAGTSAHAQANRAPLTAVLDFQNDTGYGGADVGRTAADALVVELSNSDKYNNQVLTRGEVSTGLSQLGIAPPLDAIDLQRLGKKINAANIATGEVLAISRREKPRQVEAVVVVRITDTETGELVNGALARGLSNPRNGSGGDDDSLVTEAISKAMYAAAHQISTYILPTATILNNEGPASVLINRGARSGIASGIDMVVTRNGLRVGAIRVGAVAADDATAGVTDLGIGIRPGDVARAVFALPSYQLRGNRVITDTDISQGAAVTPTHKNAIAGVGGVILALLAAALLVALVNRGSNSGTIGGGNISNVTAQSVYGAAGALPYDFTGLLVTIVSATTTTTTTTTTTGTTGTVPIVIATGAEVNQASYGVRLSWKTGNVNPTDIIAFNIYRDNFTPFSSFVGSTAGTTSGGTTTTTTTGGFNTFASGPVASVPASSRSTIDYGNTRGVSFPYIVTGGGGGGTATTGTTTSGSSTSSSTSGSTSGLNTGSIGNGSETLVPGPMLGQPTQYEVTAVYLYRLPAGGSTTSTSGTTTGTTTSGTTSGNGTAYAETALQTGGAGLVTPVVPPDIYPVAVTGTQFANGFTSNVVNLNGTQAYNQTTVALSSVTFSFASTPGADTYVLDVSSDQRFVHKKVIGPVIATPAFASAAAGSAVLNIVGTPVNFQNVNLKTLFPGVKTFYYRIGVKNSSDSPGPFNNASINPNPDLGPANSSYVYSLVGNFSGI